MQAGCSRCRVARAHGRARLRRGDPGSGVAGLSCAWKLAREGHADFVVVAGPEYAGNAAGGALDGLDYPTGAHYLPLPSRESTHVREMLADSA